jgi:hypothetical protein
VEAVSLMIFEAPATQFSLMISKPTWAVCALECMAVSLMLSETLGLFALSNPCVTRGSTFVDDLCGHMGCLLCLIHASPVEAVLLMISDSAATEFLLMI